MRLPPPLRQLYDLWMAFSKVLGKVMSFIILTILWLIGFGIYAIVMKIIALTASKTPKATYWIEVPTLSEETFHRQF